MSVKHEQLEKLHRFLDVTRERAERTNHVDLHTRKILGWMHILVCTCDVHPRVVVYIGADADVWDDTYAFI